MISSPLANGCAPISRSSSSSPRSERSRPSTITIAWSRPSERSTLSGARLAEESSDEGRPGRLVNACAVGALALVSQTCYMHRMLRHIMLLVVCLSATPRGAQDQPRPAVPVEAISGIVDAFRTHRLVGLSEGPHGNVEGHHFRLSLIRDPRFSATVNDVVVEFGSGKYQSLMDGFVRGDAVDDESLRRVWEDTANANPGWERPIYKEFFHAVRAVNAGLPPGRQLRVLLGSPPIKWETIRTRDDLRAATKAHGSYKEDLIRREVLAKNRRALLIFGDGHFQGRGEGLGLSGAFEREGVYVWTISSGGGTNRFEVPVGQADMVTWPVPSLATLRGTILGMKEYGFFYEVPPVRAEFWRAMKLEGQFDALLWLGPTRTFAEIPAALCADERYMAMRLSRMAIGIGQAAADRFEQQCAERVGR